MTRHLVELGALFLRLGLTAFGGPAAHIALIRRECVERRQWMSGARFLDLLGVANLIPGPTSTELAMHVGRQRAGWPGLIVAGVAFILPAALLVGILAALYVRTGDVPAVRGVLAAVQPVVLVLILQALIPLSRSAIRSVTTAATAVASGVAAIVGVSEIAVLLAAGALHMIVDRRMAAAASVVLAAGVAVSAAGTQITATDVFNYFFRVGSLLFGSGYVLLPILEGDLVQGRGWLSRGQLLDAIAAGQATPGPVFTTATFIGYVLGGPWFAALATIGMFLPAFLFSALSSATLDRLLRSRQARRFLDGVNAAAVALIAVVLVTLATTALRGPVRVAIFLLAGAAIFFARLNPALVIGAAAVAGAVYGLLGPAV